MSGAGTLSNDNHDLSDIHCAGGNQFLAVRNDYGDLGSRPIGDRNGHHHSCR